MHTTLSPPIILEFTFVIEMIMNKITYILGILKIIIKHAISCNIVIVKTQDPEYNLLEVYKQCIN